MNVLRTAGDVFVWTVFTLLTLQLSAQDTQHQWKFESTSDVQGIRYYEFPVKGFDFVIRDAATDSMGNHLFVGDLITTTDNVDERDTSFQRLFGDFFRMEEYIGFVVSTDSAFNFKAYRMTYSGNHVQYDPKRGNFIIAANFFDYREVDGDYTSLWQPIIMVGGADLRFDFYSIELDYSFYQQALLNTPDGIVIVGDRKFPSSIGHPKETMEVLEIDTSSYKMKDYFKHVKIRQVYQGNTDFEGRVTISDVSATASKLLFTTSNLNQHELQNVHFMYTYSPEGLVNVTDSINLMLFDSGNPYWFNILNCQQNAKGDIMLLVNKAATKEPLGLLKMNQAFEVLDVKEFEVDEYPEMSWFKVLDDDRILLFINRENERWEVKLLNSSMEELKSMSLDVTTDFRIRDVFQQDDNTVEVQFGKVSGRKRGAKMCTLQLD